ncbi:MAG: rod shape-determining protein MreC [Candidatus Nanopelagicales bacterium]|jgi:rod shape-determining protein MreC|nr:rod shape-determining protein MreC [Candidatus Nanopelagicales bacterium]MCU0298951.1 rod shape-determining protein MreC [Candidatus Nanopelagicales bacterium]
MTRTRNVVVILVVASLALILWDLRASDTALSAAVQSVVTPLQRTATAVFAPFGAWAREVEQFSDPGARTVDAQRIDTPAGWKTATGRVVAADISGSRAEVTVDVGGASGLRRGNAVLAPGGLVGTVVEVRPDAAVVRLITDPRSSIGARILPSQEMGVANGTGVGSAVRIDVLNPAADIAVGQNVVTLGSAQRDGIPADLRLGTVGALDRQSTSGRTAWTQPVTAMTSLDTVVVLTEPT